MICLTLKPSESFFVYRIQNKEKNLQKKSFSRKRGCGGLSKNRNKSFLTALAIVTKKDPTTSVRKHPNGLKVHEKTMRTSIKQDLNPDHNPHDYTIWGVLENKKMHLPIQILVGLRLLLSRNGIKCPKNLF